MAVSSGSVGTARHGNQAICPDCSNLKDNQDSYCPTPSGSDPQASHSSACCRSRTRTSTSPKRASPNSFTVDRSATSASTTRPQEPSWHTSPLLLHSPTASFDHSATARSTFSTTAATSAQLSPLRNLHKHPTPLQVNQQH